MPNFLANLDGSGRAPRDVQVQALTWLQDNWDNYRVFALNMPTGCHEPGTGIRMFDGSVRAVEEIAVGDQVMGPDSLPRRVLSLHQGTDLMYRIVPVKGEAFVVNAGHVLSLKETHDGKRWDKGGRVNNVSVKTYLGRSKYFKHVNKLYRSSVSYPKVEQKIDPYFLGLWLGDGTTDSVSVTTIDAEIRDAVYQFAKSVDMQVRVAGKQLTEAKTYYVTSGRVGGMETAAQKLFRHYGLLGNKHVPRDYEVADENQRLQLLAGLLDTDGHLSHSGFDYISELPHLAQSVATVSRSLGLAAYVQPCEKRDQNGGGGTYYRVSISGDTDKIPCRLPRKKAGPRGQKKDVLVTGIRSVEPAGVGEYYGFEVDRDNLYLMSDFTVTHNSGKSMVARAIQLATGAPIITANNILLDQYRSEYGMNYVKGRDHYTSPCGLPCDTACPIVVGDPACAGCPYKIARARALAEEPTVYNPASLFYLAGGKVPGAVRVIDEADLLSDFAKMLCSFSFSKSKYGWTDRQLSELELEAWLKDLVRRLEKLAKTHLTAGDTKEYGKVCKDLDRIRQTRTAFCQAPEQFAIWKEKKRSRGRMEEYLNLQPILPPKHFRDAVLGQGKVILMSGTLFDPDIKELVPGEPYGYLSLKSPIPADRRPIIYRPIADKVSYETPVEDLAKSIDAVLSDYPEQNCVVHLSYSDAERVSKYLQSATISHQKATKNAVLREFKKTGGVLLASGCSVGVDLPGDQCRLIYIPRLLKPNLGDPAVKKRKALPGGQEWYDWQVIKQVVQGIGRGCRGPEDYCLSVVGDPAFARLMLQYFDKVPKGILESIKWA